LVGLRRYIATDGNMGVCPDWYALFVAADTLHVPPWELLEQSIWWQRKAIILNAASHQGRAMKEQMKG